MIFLIKKRVCGLFSICLPPPSWWGVHTTETVIGGGTHTHQAACAAQFSFPPTKNLIKCGLLSSYWLCTWFLLSSKCKFKKNDFTLLFLILFKAMQIACLVPSSYILMIFQCVHQEGQHLCWRQNLIHVIIQLHKIMTYKWFVAVYFTLAYNNFIECWFALCDIAHWLK